MNGMGGGESEDGWRGCEGEKKRVLGFMKVVWGDLLRGEQRPAEAAAASKGSRGACGRGGSPKKPRSELMRQHLRLWGMNGGWWVVVRH